MKKIIAVWLAVALTATVVEAFNISPFTFKLRSRATPGDSTFIRGDTMFTNEMNVLLGVTIQATNKLRADTLQSLSTHDTTRVLGTMFTDTARVGGRLYFGWSGFSRYLDSARVDSIIQQLGRFAPGGAGSGDIEGVTAGNGLSGGGITGTVTLDVKTGWGLTIQNDSVKVNATDVMDSITSGSSSTNADSLAHKIARMRPTTNGYVLAYDNDSLYLKADATGAGADSDAVRYRADRYGSYSDTGIYFGDSGDMTMWWCNLTDTNIIAFVKVYYNEDLPDSALVTWHTLQSAISGMGGDITGVVTNSPITGGAASGDVNLSLDMDWFVAWLDSVTTATIPVADTARDVVKSGSDPMYITQIGTGPITIQAADGSVQIEADQNTGAGTTGRIYFYVGNTITSSMNLDSLGLTLGANDRLRIGGVTYYNLSGNGLSTGNSANYALDVVAGTSTGLAVNADSVYVAASGIGATQIASDAVTEAKLKAVDSPSDEEFLTYETTTGDFEWQGEVGDISNVGVTAPITGGGSSGSVAIAFDWQWLWGFVDTTIATLPHATLADSSVAAGRARLLVAAQGTANTFGRMVGDSIDVDSIHAGRISVGTDASITDITGTGLAIAAGALTASLGTAIDNSEITDQTIDKSDIDTTASNFAFDDAFHVTTAVADSEYATLNYVRAKALSIMDTSHAVIQGVVAGSGLTGGADTGRVTINVVGSDEITVATDSIFVADSKIKSVHIADQSLGTADLDSADNFAMTQAEIYNMLYCNQMQSESAGVSIKIGSGAAGLTVDSKFTLGTDITDDTVIVTLPSEWAGMVLSRGYGSDSTKYWDSLTIRGGSDSYGNYIEFAKLTDTTSSALRRRHLQVAIPVPMDADTVYDVAMSFRVFDGAGGESTYVRLKWSTTPFDSTNAYKVAYTELDSSNATTFDTLSASYSRTAVSRGSKIYALVTGLLWDKHVTWIRCYDIIMTYHRRYL